MIQFDKTTLEKWKQENIHTLSIYFYKSGCAGTKIQVEEGINPLCTHQILQDNLSLYVKENEVDLILNGRVTQVGKKWIFTSQNINTRCGCGSSFSFKSESPLRDKVERLRLALKTKRDGVHK